MHVRVSMHSTGYSHLERHIVLRAPLWGHTYAEPRVPALALSLMQAGRQGTLRCLPVGAQAWHDGVGPVLSDGLSEGLVRS